MSRSDREIATTEAQRSGCFAHVDSVARLDFIDYGEVVAAAARKAGLAEGRASMRSEVGKLRGLLNEALGQLDEYRRDIADMRDRLAAKE